jgi:Ser/Thr protein kinase RdoA (MazF antagonist)
MPGSRPATHLVHGLDGGWEPSRWPPLDDVEVARLLARYGLQGATDWHSPRPMSSAATVSTPGGRLFVKRHPAALRRPERLRLEHAFAAWLRQRGVALPEVLPTIEGDTVVIAGGSVYEVHGPLPGEDSYRDAPSWTPYRRPEHAAAAGAALARFHAAASGFEAPDWPPGPLVDSVGVVTAPDPLAALIGLVRARPPLAAWTRGRPFERDLEGVLGPHLEAAAAAGLGRARPLWTHGDWHPSNLAWSGGRVAGVFDLGLANRTFAAHDLAVAIERACVGWLAPPPGPDCFDRAALAGLLGGYGAFDARLLAAALPVAHVEYALSEVEYFLAVTESAAGAARAWDGYLLGHARWWSRRPGRQLLEALQEPDLPVLHL